MPRAQSERVERQPPRPLEEDERPPALIVSIAVCLALALGVIVGAVSVHDLSRHGGSLPGALLLALTLLLLARGMYRRRYWAVLCFQALLAFQILHLAGARRRLDHLGRRAVRAQHHARR